MANYIYIPSVASFQLLEAIKDPIIIYDSKQILQILQKNNIDNKIRYIPRFRYNSIWDLIFLPFIILKLRLKCNDTLIFGFNAHDYKFIFYILFLDKFTDVKLKYIACDQIRRPCQKKSLLALMLNQIQNVSGDFGKVTLGFNADFLKKIEFSKNKSTQHKNYYKNNRTRKSLVLLPGGSIPGLRYEKLARKIKQLQPDYIKDHPTRETPIDLQTVNDNIKIISRVKLLALLIKKHDISKVYTLPSQAVNELRQLDVEVIIINDSKLFSNSCDYEKFIQNTTH